MSNSLIELELFENSDLNEPQNFYPDPLNLSDISPISKSKLAEPYHFLCKKCYSIPVIKFIKKNKIKFICKCKESPQELSFKDIFDILYYSEVNEIEIIEKLKCHLHPNEKNIYYCEYYNKNLCSKCADDCFDHEKQLKIMAFDKNTINKSKYIIKKIKEKNQNFVDVDDDVVNSESEEDVNNNSINFKFISEKNIINKVAIASESNDIENISSNEDEYFIVTKEENKSKDSFKNKENIEEIIKIINENNNYEFNEENIYYCTNLFDIILDDYQNYPNFNHIETISNIGKYVILYFDDYNEINLRYEFHEEDIKNNTLELFGEKFVKNNKENCFLVIDENIIELNQFINLSDIFNKIEIIIPIHLDIKLIENKNKIMTDLSFMLYEITTITSESNFDNFNSKKIINMSYMFYNCSSLVKLPDISKLNTSNVKDMSYMFYNCSSLIELPDISKWNLEKLIDASHMFHNCKSLNSLPNISIWNINNIKNMKDMFNNCKSLTSIPDLSRWNIKDAENDGMFEGCKLLEENFNEYKNYDFLKRLLNIFYCVCLKIYYMILLFGLITIFTFFLFGFLIPVYYSFQLDNLNEYTYNPNKYFNLTNHLNISHIIDILNITDSSEIKRIINNKENFTINLINFTKINGGIKFESDLKKLKFYNVLSLIINIIKIIIILILTFKNYNVFIKFLKSLNILF